MSNLELPRPSPALPLPWWGWRFGTLALPVYGAPGTFVFVRAIQSPRGKRYLFTSARAVWAGPVSRN